MRDEGKPYPMATLEEKAFREYSKDKPTGICSCLHTGGGANSEHADNYSPDLSPGYGECVICEGPAFCPKFTWVNWTSEFQKILDGLPVG